jgi:putative aldouronate transport system permease protein
MLYSKRGVYYMKIKQPVATKVFNIIGYVLITIITIFCLLPFIMVVSGSLTNEEYIIMHGYSLWPKDFSTQAYKTIFTYPKQILTAYGVTIMVTIIGTALGLFLISMGAYVLNRKDFKYRNGMSFYIYFTTLFGGGLIPWYILMTKYLHLKDTYLVLILPLLMTPFLIILMRNFFKSIPDSIVESAKIDGAGDFTIYAKLIMPLSKSALATIGLFLALAYWNDWFISSIYIDTPSKYTLQYLLYKILQDAEFLKSNAASNVTSSIQIPTETLKLATAVVATGPVILFYPFVQKYFVDGLIVGAVKG